MSDVLDLWIERAAIMESEAGMNRFEAETRAAERYGTTRHLMMKEMRDADGCGLAGGHGYSARTMGGERDADDLPGMQPVAKEENGSVPERQPQAGRDRRELLALRMGGGEVV